MAEKGEPVVRVLTPDGDEARAVAKAMASNTAGGILRVFQGQEKTASDIADALNLPIPTILYHLDALVDAGLIEVSRIRYSVKGREVKVYRQSDRVLIVAPQQADLREVLLKYASLFGITVLGAGVVSLISRVGSPEAGLVLGVMKEKAVMAAVEVHNASDMVSGGNPVLSAPVSHAGGIPEIAIGILIGGCLVIGFLICFDLVSRRRNR
jgi:DNA-binding transcriptional ArsR family regulator